VGALRAGGGGRDECEAGARVMWGVERDIARRGAPRWSVGWRRLTRIWRSDTSANVDDEIRFHFEQKVAEFVALGMSPAAARTRAEAEFGDIESVRESLRAIDDRVEKKQRHAEWWEGAAQDLRYVLRSLRRSPAFTVTVVVTLALGLGANAALFAILDRLYVQPPAGITDLSKTKGVFQQTTNSGAPYLRAFFAYLELRELRQNAPSGVTIAGYRQSQFRFGRNPDANQIGGTAVEGDYFGVIGLRPEVGRFFTPEEAVISGIAMVAVISNDFWHRQYDGDPNILGKDLDLGSHRYQIIGVAPPKFRGLDLSVSDVFVPMNSTGTLKDRKTDWYETMNFNGIFIVAHVGDDATAKLFDARATATLRRAGMMKDTLSRTYVGSISAGGASARFAKEMAISTRLAGVAIVILLIACANVVNLMLARGATRKREIAVRLALGVSRRRLLTQLMIESGVLALLSAVAAIFVAFVAATTLRNLLLPDVHWGSTAIDERVALFTFTLALVTGFVAGLVPALQASSPDLSSSLKSSVRDGGQRRSALRSGLLIAQAALSVVLLVGAGVFVQSLRTVEGIDTGFDTDRLVTASVGYDRELGDHRAEIETRMPSAAERVRRIPGVQTVAMTSNVPMYGFSFTDLFLPGRDSLPPSRGLERILNVVSPEYFAAVGLKVLRGRAFTDADQASSEQVMAMNANMAANLWPGEDPLTKCVMVGKRDAPCRRVIAIVSPAHFSSIVEEPSSSYYVPLAQYLDHGGAGALVVRVAPGQAARVAAQIPRELAQEFGGWSRTSVKTMDEIFAPQMRPWRIGAALFTAAGLLALLVAAVGVYSSIAYTVSQRAQEVGVRIALGASASNIMRLVVSEGVRVVAIGVAIGVAVALALGSLVASMLYKTSPRDPFVIVASTMTLLVVAVVACCIPAWRASRVDPLTAMRAE
jgi:putative ABC transport system permease protein